MPIIEIIKTEKGEYKKDALGVWHYVQEFGAMGPLLTDALVNPPCGPIYFWFNKFPAPLFPEDTVESLFARWSQEKENFTSNKTSNSAAILRDLQKSAFSETS